MKPILTTMTALAVVLSSVAGADAAMNLNLPAKPPKPQIVKIKPPQIRTPRNFVKPVRVPRRNDEPSKVEAGPQPEPPTSPRLKFERTAMIAPPLPRSRPDHVGNEADDEAFDHLLELIGLNTNEPPVRGDPAPGAYNEFKEQDDIPGGEVDADGALGPDFPVPAGFLDLFGVTTNPNDLRLVAELEHYRAMGDIARQMPASPFDDPAGRLGRGRFGAGMDGPSGADDGTAQNPGHAGNDWQKHPGRVPGRTAWTRNHTAGFENFVRQDHVDGSSTAEYSYNLHNGDTVTTVHIRVSAPDKNGNRTVTITETVVGDDEESVRTSTTTSRAGPTPDDWDADGEDDDAEAADTTQGDDGNDAEADQDTTAGGGDQGAPNDNDTGRGDGGCGTWTLFGGCTGTGLKIWDTTGQPNPTDDGSDNGRNAGASIGPEAVTNGGDGSFVSGQGRGGGGPGLDPCATAGPSCGNGPDGPGSPAGPDRPGRSG